MNKVFVIHMKNPTVHKWSKVRANLKEFLGNPSRLGRTYFSGSAYIDHNTKQKWSMTESLRVSVWGKWDGTPPHMAYLTAYSKGHGLTFSNDVHVEVN